MQSLKASFAAVLLCLPLAAAAKNGDAIAPARQALRAQCLLNAADPKNPWALAHGMVAFGPSFAASDGRNAADVMVKDFLQKSPDPQQGPFAFQRYASDGGPIDPHPNLLIKSMVLSGIKDSRTFDSAVGKVSLGELVKMVETSFRHVPQNEQYWEDVGWTLDLLAERLSPKDAKFKTGDGKVVDFNEVMDDALAYLDLANKDLADGMAKNLPVVPKRKQGVYAHSCGALHLVQAIDHWARYPEIRKRWGKRFDKQIDVLFYRLGSEQRQYDAAYNAMPQYRLQLLVQMVKFYGHFLETTGRLRDDLHFKPNAKQRATIAQAKILLAHAVTELQQIHAFESMDAYKKSQPQLYLDLIGDSCHAAHGLEMWK